MWLCQVVILNQVTAKHSHGSFHLALALGDSWSHESTTRIILYWNGNQRYMYVDKSPSLRYAPYSMIPKGIENCASNNKRTKIYKSLSFILTRVAFLRAGVFSGNNFSSL